MNVGCPLPVTGRSLESALSNSCVDPGSGDPGGRDRHPSARCVRGTRWFVQNLADQMSLEGISFPVLVKVLASPQREKLELRNHQVPVSFIQQVFACIFQIMYYSKVVLRSVALIMLTKPFCYCLKVRCESCPWKDDRQMVLQMHFWTKGTRNLAGVWSPGS